MINSTEGVLWELENIISHSAFAKTLFLIDPRAKDNELWQKLTKLIIPIFARAGVLAPDFHFAGHPIGFYFSGDKFVEIENNNWSATSYRTAFSHYLSERAPPLIVPHTIARKAVAICGLILAILSFIPLLVSMMQSERKEIASDDGKVRVSIPGTWTKLPELNKQASLQVGNGHNEVYLMVITDIKADLANFTLEKHQQRTRERMLDKMKNASATQPVSLTIDGHPALQDQITGTENGTDIVILHTTVDDGDHFQQILAWTLKSRWEKQNQLLREVTNSFRSQR